MIKEAVTLVYPEITTSELFNHAVKENVKQAVGFLPDLANR